MNSLCLYITEKIESTHSGRPATCLYANIFPVEVSASTSISLDFSRHAGQFTAPPPSRQQSYEVVKLPRYSRYPLREGAVAWQQKPDVLRWREIAVVKVIRGPRRHRPTISVGFVECHDVIQTHFTEFDWYISELGGWGGSHVLKCK